MTTQRLIVMKTKAESVRKAAALDVLTNLPLALSIPKELAMEDLAADKEYLASLKVYTSKNLQRVDEEFIISLTQWTLTKRRGLHQSLLGLSG